MLSSVDRDRLELVSYDLISGAQNVEASATADIDKVILDPNDFQPDIVEFDDSLPQLKVVNQRVAQDVHRLQSQGLGVPSILDRAPGDNYWLVKYISKPGAPIYARYQRSTGQLSRITIQNWPERVKEWRPNFISIEREGKSLGGYVAMPDRNQCGKDGCPAVLLIHGGPGARDHFTFDRQRFWLTDRGIAVITVNYRGSKGFGKIQESRDVGEWGGGIPADIEAAVDQAMRTFPIDRKRVAVMGSSFGGLQALNLLASSDRYRCGVVDSMFTDVLKFSEYRFELYGEKSDLLGRIGDPRIEEEQQILRKLSPAEKIDRLSMIPILQLHGEADEVVPMRMNEIFSTRMQEKNPEYTYVHVMGGRHGLDGMEDSRIYHSVAEQFLGKCLGVKTEALSEKERQSLKERALVFGAKYYMNISN